MHVTYRAQVRGVVRERVQDMMPLSLMSSSFGQPKIELVLSVFTSQWVEKFNLPHILHNPTVQAAFPMPGIRLTAVWKYNPTIGQAFCNTRSINRKMQIDADTKREAGARQGASTMLLPPRKVATICPPQLRPH